VQLSRDELAEMLRRADLLVTKLRRSTLELAALGDHLMALRQERREHRPH
jgi:hypothetical protein